MAARILHFGQDECNRVIVLRSAGYSVEACPSLPNLDAALRKDAEPDAVVFSERHAPARHNGLTLVRSGSSAPVILFEHTLYYPDEPEYDLVIPNLTPVQEWLDRIAAIIAQKPRSMDQGTIDPRGVDPAAKGIERPAGEMFSRAPAFLPRARESQRDARRLSSAKAFFRSKDRVVGVESG